MTECSPDGDDFADELTLPSITVGMKIICYECFELCNVYQIKGPNGICVSACKDEDYDGRCDHCPCYLRYKKSEEGEQP